MESVYLQYWHKINNYKVGLQEYCDNMGNRQVVFHALSYKDEEKDSLLSEKKNVWGVDSKILTDDHWLWDNIGNRKLNIKSIFWQ